MGLTDSFCLDGKSLVHGMQVSQFLMFSMVVLRMWFATTFVFSRSLLYGVRTVRRTNFVHGIVENFDSLTCTCSDVNKGILVDRTFYQCVL